ncbi:MAG: hypothetical protein NVS9B12_02390 [Vulcanimicrobiaceae bacterium]
MITRIARAWTLFAGLLVTAACSAGATSGPTISTTNPSSPSYSSLQFAVGTANIYGTATGLNVVSTFRQINGRSATGVNTPSITGPFTFTAPAVSGGSAAEPYSTVLKAGPSLSETTASVPAITGTPQTVMPGTPFCDGVAVPAGFLPCKGSFPPNTTTFGQSGGVFAMGLGPYNAVAASGQAYSYAPYAQPFYDVSSAPAAPPASNFSFRPWGGPPAFDPNGTGMGERDGVGSINGFDSFGLPFFLGVAEGITVFDGVTPGAGGYQLNVAISTVGSGGAITTSNVIAKATLASLATLPALTAPAVTPDANGDGGATFTAGLPANVTEAYVQIVDFGPLGGPNDGFAPKPANCQGARGTVFAPVYYTIHITSPAAALYTLPATIGPNLATTGGVANKLPSPSICTAAQNTAANGAPTNADDYVVQMIGFDYPIYQAALGLTQPTTPQNPVITNASGQADITISLPAEQDAGGAPVPISVRRAPQRAVVGHH